MNAVPTLTSAALNSGSGTFSTPASEASSTSPVSTTFVSPLDRNFETVELKEDAARREADAG
jgi:hypothetical protein